tara:strand:- start:2779 stop:3060 length:282 start_codon:yes stop_codon:yes gene_type:complete
MLMIKRLMTQHLPGMLTCEEVDGFLYNFHEGSLSTTEKLKFKLHLSMCSECRAYVQGYKNTIRISQRGFIQTNPIENVPEELMQVILKSRTTK